MNVTNLGIRLCLQFYTHYTDDDENGGDDENDGDLCPSTHLMDVLGGAHRYSQLSSCRVHTCLSMGYLVRSMLQAMVAVMLWRLLETFKTAALV